MAKGFDSGVYTGMILIDLQKAFDTVDHEILLEKMSFVGFSKQVIDWFRSYLSNRTFKVKIGKTFSDDGNLTCGGCSSEDPSLALCFFTMKDGIWFTRLCLIFSDLKQERGRGRVSLEPQITNHNFQSLYRLTRGRTFQSKILQTYQVYIKQMWGQLSSKTNRSWNIAVSYFVYLFLMCDCCVRVDKFHGCFSFVFFISIELPLALKLKLDYI